MKKLINPLDSELQITLNYPDETYTIEPFGELVVSDEVAKHWSTKIHQFLKVEDVDKPKTKKVESAESEDEPNTK